MITYDAVDSVEGEERYIMDKLYIIIPAYNEEENIRNIIHDWYDIINRIGGGQTRNYR